MDPSEESNFQLFRDCLATPLLEHSTSSSTSCTTATSTRKKNRKAHSGRKTAIKATVHAETEPSNDAAELGEFIDIDEERQQQQYLASEIFASLPSSLRTLSHAVPSLYSTPLPVSTSTSILEAALPLSATDSLTAYGFLPASASASRSRNGSSTSSAEFLAPVLGAYVAALLTPPPPPRQTLRDVHACEICERGWVPLTYHHLIPRAVHARVLRRGWHAESELDSVAWLCRACHSCVHRVAGNEELARDYFTVERLREREDVRRFGEWAGKVRWKAR